MDKNEHCSLTIFFSPFDPLQLSQEVQGHETQGAAKLVQANFEGPSFSPHQNAAHHPQGSKM